MFKANMLKNREALQAEKSATMIFNQAMLKFQLFEFEESFPSLKEQQRNEKTTTCKR